MVPIKWFNNKIRPHLLRCSSFSSNNKYEYYFPEEILIQILCRLPEDRVLLFKRVCRRWKSIISSSEFVTHLRITLDHQMNHHNNNNPISSIFMFTASYNGMQEFGIFEDVLGFEGIKKRKIMTRRISRYDEVREPKPHDDTLNNLWLIGSCDGLLMFDKSGPRAAWMFLKDVEHWILVLNPMIRERRVIEYPRGPPRYVCAIFFDRFQHEHNILHVSNKTELSPEVYHIFSFTQSAWRIVQIASTRQCSSLGRANYRSPPCMHAHPPVLVADALHWFVDEHEFLSKSMMAFRIQTKDIHYFPHPMIATNEDFRYTESCETCSSNFNKGYTTIMQLIEHNGKLCFCRVLKRSSRIDIWVLEEYGYWSSWVLRFKVNVPPAKPIYFDWHSMCDWGPIILSFPHKDVIVVKWNRNKIYLYNLITHKSSWIDDDSMIYGPYQLLL